MATNPDQQQLRLRHGIPGTVYVLHFEPYKHVRHYIGWTADDVDTRLAVHLQGRGSALIRAAVSAPSRSGSPRPTPAPAASSERLKRWHKTNQFCAICRQHRDGRPG